MSFKLLYWILMILWAVFGVWGTPRQAGQPAYRTWGGTLLLFVLLVLLGWKVFDAPIHP